MNLSDKELKAIIAEEIELALEELAEGEGKKDACYHKVKRSAKVWPSAYASGRLVQCRKVGAANYGNKSKKNEEVEKDSEEDVIDAGEEKQLRKVQKQLKDAVKAHDKQQEIIDDVIDEEVNLAKKIRIKVTKKLEEET